MREEYDIENLNPRRNPYAKRLRKQIADERIINRKYIKSKNGVKNDGCSN